MILRHKGVNLMVGTGYPTAEQAMATAFAYAEIGDEAVQHEATCDLSEECGCEVIVYRLHVDGWKEHRVRWPTCGKYEASEE